ncbi:MAG: ArnT family glycosyltransferase [Aggregatilineales bacterium]
MMRSKTGFAIGLAVVALTALALRLTGFNFSLPYVDHADEPNFYLAGLEWRGLFDNGNYYDGYPPTYLALQAAVQPALEAAGVVGLSPTVQVMRLVSIAAGLGTLICIALTARLAAGDLAGLVAGAAWALSPIAVENGVYAIPDPLVYFFTALALWLSVAALADPRRRWWSVWGLAAAITAVLLKYPVLPVVGVPLAAGLLIWQRDRRPRYLLLQLALALAVTLWFFLVYTADIQPEGTEYEAVSQSGLAGFLDAGRAANNVNQALLPLGPLAFALYLGAGGLAWLLARRLGRPRADWVTAGLCLYLLLTIPWVAAAYIAVDLGRARAVLPATTAACVLLGLAVAQIGALLPRRWPALAAVPLAALVFVPQLQADVALMQNRLLPDRRVALRQWFDASLDPGTVLVYRDNHKTFNPIWGGIPHRRWVDWIETTNITEKPVEVWRDVHGVSYAALPRADVEALQATAAGRAYLAKLLRLRDFFAPPLARGPETAFFRLWPMEHPLNVLFGSDIALVGWDDEGALRPGQTLTLRLYWRALDRPDDNYSLFVHLAALSDPKPLAQLDGPPAAPDRPTLTWDAPGETLISPALALALPPDLPLGAYRLLVGLYDYDTGARLPLNGTAADAFELLRFAVG